MAKADSSFNIALLPREGLSLKATIAHFVGPDLLAAYFAARDACRGFPLQIAGSRSLTADEQRQSARREELWRACITPPLDAWNSGKLDAAGSRGDQLAKLELIPPPAITAWNFRVLDLDRSIIRDPKGGKIFGLRFFERGMGPVATPLPVSIIGSVEMASPRTQFDDEDIPTHALIKNLAIEEFGDALCYAELREIMYRVGPKIDAMKLPAPSRFQYAHALEGMYRKRPRRGRAKNK